MPSEFGVVNRVLRTMMCLLRKQNLNSRFLCPFSILVFLPKYFFTGLLKKLLPCVLAFQEAASNVSDCLEHLPELPFQMRNSQDFRENLHSKSSAPLIRVRDHKIGREKYFCSQSKQLCNRAAKQGNLYRQLLFWSSNSGRFSFLFLSCLFVCLFLWPLKISYKSFPKDAFFGWLLVNSSWMFWPSRASVLCQLLQTMSKATENVLSKSFWKQFLLHK